MGENWYDMQCGETLIVTESTDLAREILRVPGGWIVTRVSGNDAGSYAASSCFVPYCSIHRVRE